ncbi:MAG: AAA family ATPase [Chthoniobacteraceae bacterium]
MKKRIHIVGGPGSGKSTYARRLAARFSAPIFSLDDLYWDQTASGYCTRADPSQRDSRLMQIVEQDKWIVEGVYHAWLSPSFQMADTIIALTVNVWIRDYRLLKRFLARKCNHTEVRRETVGDLWRLMRWNHIYDSEQLPKTLELVTKLGCDVTYCHDWRAVLNAATLPPRLQPPSGRSISLMMESSSRF